MVKAFSFVYRGSCTGLPCIGFGIGFGIGLRLGFVWGLVGWGFTLMVVGPSL